LPGFDDEDEYEAPHEWRPRHVFRLFACYFTNAPNIGCHRLAPGVEKLSVTRSLAQ
jgi:hypothetical protein